jgi:hypothetical protein
MQAERSRSMPAEQGEELTGRIQMFLAVLVYFHAQ